MIMMLMIMIIMIMMDLVVRSVMNDVHTADDDDMMNVLTTHRVIMYQVLHTEGVSPHRQPSPVPGQ